jgi:uncharacterized membrane protein
MREVFGLVADRAVAVFASPWFLLVQLVVVVGWLALNALAVVGFDRPPFILLNLAFSTEAAFAAPLILFAQMRQDRRDRQRDETLEAAHSHIAAQQLRMLEELAAHRQTVETEPDGQVGL